jgi:multimeric flavodoxin WrbA
MDILMPKLAESDIMVLATPVYADGMTGALKIFIERMIPAISPFIEIIDGHSRHPSGRPGKKALLVLVANCGLYEMDNFDPLLAYMQALSRSMSAEFAGALLRPHGPFLKPMLDMGMPVQDVLEAAKLVGCQLVETGKISSETLDTISRPLLPLQMYIQLFNQHVQQMMPA